jgi:serine/threonine-protein kinase
LALEVFDRGCRFDPRTDSVVRSEARNLRARLNEYYMGEGRSDPVLIELPKGTYVPLFHAAVSSAESSPRRGLPRWHLAAGGILATVVVGSGWWLLRPGTARESPAGAPTLAVLPFVNLSGGASSDYMADGFVEDLTTRLAVHRGLRVAARTSAFQFRGKNEDVRQIGRQLGVSAVLEGSLRNEGAAQRITAQLISTSTGYHLWSGNFTCDLHGVQDATRARQEAARALQLEETSPEAHTALAILSWSYDRDWAAAERSFKHAIELNPSYAWAHKIYALALTSHARFDDSLEQIRLAQILDPVSILSANDLAAILYDARRYDEAIGEARRHLEMDPRFFPAHSLIGLSQAARGNLAEAITSLEKAANQGKQYPELAGSLGNLLARGGRVAEANAILDHIRQDYPDSGAVAVSLSLVHIGLGEKTKALVELRRAADLHAPGVNFIGVEPIFDPLRVDPEFQALCVQLGLPNHGPPQ